MKRPTEKLPSRIGLMVGHDNPSRCPVPAHVCVALPSTQVSSYDEWRNGSDRRTHGRTPSHDARFAPASLPASLTHFSQSPCLVHVLLKTTPEKFGFRSGEKGTHTSRTIMFDELSTLLQGAEPGSRRPAYLTAIIEQNALSKATTATRKLTAQRLSELYILDPSAPMFRVLQKFWQDDVLGRPLIALLCALARDPLLRATADPVLSMSVGEELSRQRMTDAIRSAVGGRLNDATLDKVARNASSSWTQSGHLHGRVRKFRKRIYPTPLATAYALMLGYLEGLRGGRLFETQWTRVLDASSADLRYIAAEAKRLGGLDFKAAGDVVEVGFSTVLTPQEIKDSRGTH